MQRKLFIVASLCALLCSAFPAWSQTGYIPDSGSTGERTCNPRSYTATDDTVTDHITGLEWIRAANLMSDLDSSFDNDGTPGDGAVYWQTALNFIEELNDNNTLGYDDWRLPTVAELLSIADFGKDNPAIDTNVFNCLSNGYWSSEAYSSDDSRAWQIFFRQSYIESQPKLSAAWVRPVRGNAYGPFGDFSDNGDGTISDDASGLMWHACNAGQTWNGSVCTGSTGGFNKTQAQEYIDSLNADVALGYDDWRLPSIHELQSIIDRTISSPATSLPGMTGTYWSATVRPTGHTWGVYISDGGTNFFSTTALQVRAVRGGPCRADGDWCIDVDDCGGSAPLCNTATDTCVECLENADCTDDGQYCTGTTTCTANACVDSGDPCSGNTPVCDETGNRCVECLTDGDCDAADRCASNICIARGTMQITKATVKAGKVRGADSMKFSGTLSAKTADVEAAMGGTITLTIEAAGIPDPANTTFTFPINAEAFKKGKYKSPKVKPAVKTDPVVGLAFDTIKGKLSFTSKNLNLTGLACPITVTIQFGEYAAVKILNEDVVNGTKPCPVL